MMCQNCGKNPATTHVKRTVNGKTAEWHLCAECAAKQGLENMFGGLGFELGDFWGSLFAEPSTREMADTLRCPGCGRRFQDIAQSGKVGCAQCYTTFYDRLLPSIQRIHGKTKHSGKVPASVPDTKAAAVPAVPAVGAVSSAPEEPAVPSPEQELKKLRAQLETCIQQQQYEQCAVLRDRIRELENGEAQNPKKGETNHE